MLFFGVNLYLSFATDTYATFRGGFYGAGIDIVMRNGRPIIGLIYELQYMIFCVYIMVLLSSIKKLVLDLDMCQQKGPPKRS